MKKSVTIRRNSLNTLDAPARSPMISAKSSVAVVGAVVVAAVGAVVEAPVDAVRSLDQSSRDDVGRDS